MSVVSSNERDSMTSKPEENLLSQTIDFGLDLHRALLQKVLI
jgi:hypothetical protein